MMQFTPTEMATIYRQAADKRKQIRVFMDTNGQTADEVKKSLLEGGILAQQFPRERNPHNNFRENGTRTTRLRESRRSQRNSRRRPQNRTRVRPGSPAT